MVGDFGPNAQPLTLRAGNYRVEIQANGYDPVMFDVNVMPGQVIPYRGVLRYYQGRFQNLRTAAYGRRKNGF